MKKLLSLVLAIAIMICVVPFGAFTLTASAAKSGVYTYTVSNGEATITDVSESISGAITIPSTLGGYPVINIGDSAFTNCWYLTSITIPDSVTSIGDHAFSCCESLTSITIPDSVTSIGDHAFFSCESLKSITIPDSVTSISEGAFSSCITLTSITILGSVTSIGRGVFYDCRNLTSITIPDSVTSIGREAFSYCTSLTSITIPNSVTSIGALAFSSCSKLDDVYYGGSYADKQKIIGIDSNPNLTSAKWHYEDTEPLVYEFDETDLTASVIDCEENVTTATISEQITNNGKTYTVASISSDAFRDCTSLISITIPDGVTSIGDYAFYNCTSLTSVTIPNSVTRISNYAFRDCTSLTSVTIPDSITSIGYEAFYNCTSLTSITIPDGVTSIGDYAFSGCTALTSVTIPDSITSIGYEAFYNCTSLTSITIPDSVTSIGRGAFGGCEKLQNIEIDDSNGCFSNVDGILFNKGKTSILCYPAGKTAEAYTIPDSVKNIGEYAFSGCTALTSVTIPNSVTRISNYAFRDCTSLTSITIPDGVTSIGDGAFYDCTSLTTVNYNAISCTNMGGYSNAFSGCTKLTTINIGSKVKNIPSYAFYNCTGLTSITIPDGVTSIGDYAFYNCTGLISITIPDGVTSIGDCAFRYCTALELVYYAGDNRSDIYIAEGNNSLEDATWYYNVCNEHKYYNDCDDSCNICGVPRTVGEHKYDNNCDDSCNICGVSRTVGEHKYSNLCDTTCNYCGAIRTVGEHKYSNLCDATCNYCGAPRTVGEHKYSNLCDTTCNYCDEPRTVGEHKYDNDCDTTCNYCGATRTVGEHKYDNDYDDSCNNCQAKRICDVCGGSGKDLFEVDCDNCTNGTDGSIDCSRCYGDGKYFKACSTCGGDGCNIYGTECSTCKGTGNGASVKCYSCSGTGKVPANCKKCGGDCLMEAEGDCLNCLGKGNVNVYKITFNANGGTYKYNEYAIKGHNKTLPIEIPTRAGYTFAGWGTTQKCGKQYSLGEVYDVEEDITLYALWYRKATCTSCKGSGSIEGKCSGCNGVGKSTYRACNNCGSTRYNQTGTMGAYCLDCRSSSIGTKTVYCDLCNGSGKGSCSICSGKGEVIVKQEPVVISFTDKTVTLMYNAGYEYSKDGITWQESNVFTNLSPVTKYTFYMRVGATDTTPFSAMGSGVSITTDKSKQTLVPNAPKVQSATSSSITLVAVDGCEYSKDGTNWQSSNGFTGLSCATKYKFYQRYKETSTSYAGKNSVALVAKTDKGTQSKPSAPTLLSKTYNSVTLTALSGYEYSRDGVNWQTSNVFKGLDAETNYMFFERKAENDKYYSSEISASLIVKTSEAPKCVINSSLHKYDNKCDADCNTCGATRKISHKYKTTTKKATLSKNGSITKKCTVCNNTNKSTIKYAKSFKLSTTTYTYNGKVKTPGVTVKDSAGKTLKKNTDYTVTYAKGRKNVGTYKVTIKLKGKYSGTKTLTFKINPAATKVSKLTAGKKSITVNISKKSTQVSGYQIQYSTSKKFTSAKTKTVSSYKTTKVTFKSLKAKKPYYVRVRTYKTVSGKKYYSSWSAYKNVKTK